MAVGPWAACPAHWPSCASSTAAAVWKGTPWPATARSPGCPRRSPAWGSRPARGPARHSSSASQLASLSRCPSAMAGDQFLRAVSGRTHQNQQARPVVGEPTAEVDPVRPDVHVVLAREIRACSSVYGPGGMGEASACWTIRCATWRSTCNAHRDLQHAQRSHPAVEDQRHQEGNRVAAADRMDRRRRDAMGTGDARRPRHRRRARAHWIAVIERQTFPLRHRAGLPSRPWTRCLSPAARASVRQLIEQQSPHLWTNSAIDPNLYCAHDPRLDADLLLGSLHPAGFLYEP